MKKIWDKYREIIMYLLFGGLTTVVALASYALFETIVPNFEIFGFTIKHTTSANVLKWACAVIFAYVTNKIWVFQSKSWKPSVALREFSVFVSSRLLTGIVGMVGFEILMMVGLNQSLFGIKGIYAVILSSAIEVIANYVFSKLFIFKRKKTIEELTKD